MKWLGDLRAQKHRAFEEGVQLSTDTLRTLQGEVRILAKLIDQFENAAGDLRKVEQGQAQR